MQEPLKWSQEAAGQEIHTDGARLQQLQAKLHCLKLLFVASTFKSNSKLVSNEISNVC